MKLRKERKIRKLLGNKYHLYTTSEGNWKLFRKYDDWDKYINESNKAIMTDETNTEKDLLKFAKDNHKIDEKKIIFTTRQIMLIIAFILCLLNFWIDSDLLRGLVLGIDLLALVQILVENEVNNHNFKIEMKEINRNFGYREDFDYFKRFHLQTKVKYNGKKYTVSTIDLGIDHNFLKKGKPLYYETMIFSKDKSDNPFEWFQRRYSTKGQAIRSHKEIIKLFKEGKVSSIASEENE